MSTSSTFSAEEYFATQPPPPTLDQDVQAVREFVSRQAKEGRNVVLVTSGGTTVPLELNVVRFLDNFSAGTRGATSAEYFLKSNYAVIFMHRQFSLQPFSRHYSHSTNPFLDFLEITSTSSSATSTPATPPSTTSPSSLPTASTTTTTSPSSDTTPEPIIGVSPTTHPDLLPILQTYKAVHSAGTLHTLTFVTVNDYLWLLRAVSQELGVLKKKAMYYLAAAVSDFFLPRQKMSIHKIQSGKGSLIIEMDQVPKILKPMVEEWANGGFVVSFKLETDPNLLIPKARGAIDRYGHQVVIGNDLHRRKYEVVFVSRDTASLNSTSRNSTSGEGAEAEGKADGQEGERKGVEGGGWEETWLRLPSNTTKEIEEDIVEELVRRHREWLKLDTE